MRIEFRIGSLAVVSSAARMPGKCWGKYRKVALLQVTTSNPPRMISTRAKGVARVLAIRDRLHSGGEGGKTAYDRAVEELIVRAVAIVEAGL